MAIEGRRNEKKRKENKWRENTFFPIYFADSPMLDPAFVC